METIITWDEPKRAANVAKHGLDFADLTDDFFIAATITPAKLGRFRAVGVLADGTVAAIFARLGTEAISVISLRPASKNERINHDKRI
jgi:uncharacterized DUF497 family protein